MCQTIGIPPISIIGFGLTSVSSAIRVPNPPASITAFIRWPSNPDGNLLTSRKKESHTPMTRDTIGRVISDAAFYRTRRKVSIRIEGPGGAINSRDYQRGPRVGPSLCLGADAIFAIGLGGCKLTARTFVSAASLEISASPDPLQWRSAPHAHRDPPFEGRAAFNSDNPSPPRRSVQPKLSADRFELRRFDQA
jgi:hypothetical protein